MIFLFFCAECFTEQPILIEDDVPVDECAYCQRRGLSSLRFTPEEWDQYKAFLPLLGPRLFVQSLLTLEEKEPK